MNDSFISNLKISKHFSEGTFGEVNKKNSLKIAFFKFFLFFLFFFNLLNFGNKRYLFFN